MLAYPQSFEVIILAFLGDADLAEQVTIDECTIITHNHDCVRINLTTIGRGAHSLQDKVKN